MQEQKNVRDALVRTQLNTIEHNLNRLIEHRANIMDLLTLEDFSSKEVLTNSLSDAEILELFPQVKEPVIEQRTLEVGYRLNGRYLSKQAKFGLQYPMQIKNNNRISDFDGGVLKHQKIQNAMAQEG